MKIGIVGGGPAGLYFGLLMKRLDRRHAVLVVDQNPAGATFGFGVVFSDRALTFLRDADPESFAEIASLLQTWDDQVIVHRDVPVRLDNIGFSGISRIELLRVLQHHCLARGIEIEFNRRLTDLTPLAGCDLVVGADGVNSIVRETYQSQFEPTSTLLTNKYVWYGTSQLFNQLTLTFREDEAGVFVAHHYRHSQDRSTFVVECDAATWHRASFDDMSEDESRQYCERVFARDLDSHALLTNRSVWLNFRLVSNRHWSHANVVLLGDALRTVHFSIGSGTRNALEDAVALYRAFERHGDAIGDALAAFEAARRPDVDKFLGVAARSADWYEHVRDKLDLEPIPFAYDYAMRGGRISHERLRQRSPAFAAAYEAYAE